MNDWEYKVYSYKKENYNANGISFNLFSNEIQSLNYKDNNQSDLLAEILRNICDLNLKPIKNERDEIDNKVMALDLFIDNIIYLIHLDRVGFIIDLILEIANKTKFKFLFYKTSINTTDAIYICPNKTYSKSDLGELIKQEKDNLQKDCSHCELKEYYKNFEIWK